MRPHYSITLILTLIVLTVSSCHKEQKQISITPEPYGISLTSGDFKLSKDITIVITDKDSSLKMVASYYADMLKVKGTNCDIEFRDSPKKRGAINLIIDPKLDTLTQEGYILSITPKKIDISSSNSEGLFRAISTLEQLIETDSTIPALKIVDKPRFGWRGMMLDIARHFQPKDSIKKFIDILAEHKINKLHLHLTDGIGWRMEIEKYPKLTELGAYRKVTPHSQSWENFALYDDKGDLSDTTKWYGGYLTKDELREIVSYASDRFIEVIPEIEMPGHSMAALSCYPQYTCPNTNGTSDVYCAGNNETFKFLSTIIDEVIEVFPSKYIHIGGDEVGKEQWLNCPLCKKRMKEKDITTGEELQSYFMKRIETHIANNNKQLIGWDEIIEGGLPKSATVMSWTGFDGGIKAATLGHDVVMAPIDHCYFDHYQGDNNFEPQGWGGYTPVEKVYNFNPIPDAIPVDKRHHILGGQANLWTETISKFSHIEYMILPRLTALCEALWSPKEVKNWERFKVKLDKKFDTYKEKGYNYSESALTPYMKSTMLGEDTLEVTLKTELNDYPIYYTLDGTEPNLTSNMYNKPIKISNCTTLKAQTFRNNEKVGYLQSYDMLMNKATGAKVSYELPYGKNYSAGGDKALVDNISAIKRGDSPYWQGVEKNDFVVTIDMKEIKEISTILLSYFQHLSTTSVVLPTAIEVFSSNDGKTFKSIEKIENFKELNRDGIVKKVLIEKEPFECRYIKVASKNIGILPAGYNRTGSPAWVFMDEIKIK